ncbi:MAG: hypothetical protein ABFR75_14185 [Acidobacteriota bacterium]
MEKKKEQKKYEKPVCLDAGEVASVLGACVSGNGDGSGVSGGCVAGGHNTGGKCDSGYQVT